MDVGNCGFVVKSGAELQSTLKTISETAREFYGTLHNPEVYKIAGGLAYVKLLVAKFQQTSAELLALAHRAHRLKCPLVTSYVFKIRNHIEDSLKQAEIVIKQFMAQEIDGQK